MVPEAPLEQTDAGLVANGDGWYVLNAKDTRWYHADGRPALCDLEGEAGFAQLGLNIVVLGPGQAMAMYHWEADQEGFLVLSGEAILIIDGEERTIRQWDYVHFRRVSRTRGSAPARSPASFSRWVRGSTP